MKSGSPELIAQYQMNESQLGDLCGADEPHRQETDRGERDEIPEIFRQCHGKDSPDCDVQL